MLDNNRYEAFRDLDTLGIGKHLLPEVWDCKDVNQPTDHHNEGSVFDHLLLVLKNIRPGLSLAAAWAALLHDTDKKDRVSYQADRIHYPMHPKISCKHVQKIAKRLSFNRKLREKIIWIIDHHHSFDDWKNMKRSTQLRYFHHQNFADLLELHRADIIGSKPGYKSVVPSKRNRKDFNGNTTGLVREKLIQQIHTIEKDYFNELTRKNQEKKLVPLLDGKDIMQLLNLKPSKKIQEIKEKILDAQLEKKITTKAEAKAFLHEQKKDAL